MSFLLKIPKKLTDSQEYLPAYSSLGKKKKKKKKEDKKERYIDNTYIHIFSDQTKA